MTQSSRLHLPLLHSASFVCSLQDRSRFTHAQEMVTVREMVVQSSTGDQDQKAALALVQGYWIPKTNKAQTENLFDFVDGNDLKTGRPLLGLKVFVR